MINRTQKACGGEEERRKKMRKIFGVGKYIFFWRKRKRTRTERQKDKNKGNAQDSEGFQANSNRGERSIETMASLDQKNKKKPLKAMIWGLKII